MKIKFLLILAVLATGCSACGGRYITARTDCYKALPLDVEKMDNIKGEYLLINFIPNAILREGEQGSSWPVLLKEKNEDISHHWATLNNNGLLSSIIPKSGKNLQGAKFFLLSHDGNYCYDQIGREFDCRGKINWEQAPVLSDKEKGIFLIRPQSDKDKKIRKAYEEFKKSKSQNTTLPEKSYNYLKARENSKITEEASKTTLKAALPFTGFLAGPLTGAITVSAGAVYLGIDLVFSEEDLNYPEYFPGANSNRQLAIAKLQNSYQLANFNVKTKEENKK